MVDSTWFLNTLRDRIKNGAANLVCVKRRQTNSFIWLDWFIVNPVGGATEQLTWIGRHVEALCQAPYDERNHGTRHKRTEPSQALEVCGKLCDVLEVPRGSILFQQL